MNQARKSTRGFRWGLGTGVLAILACLPTKREETAGSGTELGNVVGAIYADSDSPAPDIEVTLYPLSGDTSGTLRTRTDSGGAFGFEASPGAYRLISLDGRGNGVTVDSIQAEEDGKVDLSRRTLTPLGSLTGHVRVSDSNDKQATLRFLGSPFTLHTAPNADFHWQNLPAGRYWLQAQYPGAANVEIPVVIEAGLSTALADTIDLVYAYSYGVSRRDTMVLSSQQLPFTVRDQVSADGVDSVYWVLNGVRHDVDAEDMLKPVLDIQRSMLRDSGLNLLELRIVLADTSVARQWYITIDDSKVKPWQYHAVRAVFLSREPNPRPDRSLIDLGRFRILQRRVMSADELVYWERTPLADPDTVIPDEVRIPIVSYQFGPPAPGGSVPVPGNKEPTIAYFPGDTLTLYLFPDTNYHAQAFRIRNDERFEDLAAMRHFPRAVWPLAEFLAGKSFEKFSKLTPFFRPYGVHFRQVGNYCYNDACAPMSRDYILDSTGRVREILAAPPGFSSENLLLHFRAYREGFVSDTVPAAPRYVYIDSSGKGLAGAQGVQRPFQLDSSELGELKGIMAGFPSPIPLAWEADYIDDSPIGPDPDSSRYLFSGNRGTIHRLAEPQFSAWKPPADKRQFFLGVDAWLKAKGWM